MTPRPRDCSALQSRASRRRVNVRASRPRRDLSPRREHPLLPEATAAPPAASRPSAACCARSALSSPGSPPPPRGRRRASARPRAPSSSSPPPFPSPYTGGAHDRRPSRCDDPQWLYRQHSLPCGRHGGRRRHRRPPRHDVGAVSPATGERARNGGGRRARVARSPAAAPRSLRARRARQNGSAASEARARRRHSTCSPRCRRSSRRPRPARRLRLGGPARPRRSRHRRRQSRPLLRLQRWDGSITASLVKPMLLVAYLRGHRSLDPAMRATLTRMITVSDDDAADAVYRYVGRRGLVRLADRAGMRSFQADGSWILCRVAATDMTRFFRDMERYIPSRHRRFANALLSGHRLLPALGYPRACRGAPGVPRVLQGGLAGRLDSGQPGGATGARQGGLGIAVFTDHNPQTATARTPPRASPPGSSAAEAAVPESAAPSGRARQGSRRRSQASFASGKRSTMPEMTPDLQIYSLEWCPYCIKAKALSGRGDPLREIDVTHNRRPSK